MERSSIWTGWWITLTLGSLLLLLGMWELSFLITVALIIFLLPTVIGIIFILFRRMRISHIEDRISSYLRSHGGSTLEEIVRGTDLDRDEVLHCLDNMISKRIVKRDERGEVSLYTLE